jgi:cell division septation protein DedD
MLKRGLMMGGAAAALLLAMPAVADVKAGVDLWTAGEYRRAVEEWRPLAVAGDADAQFNLGQAYKLGRGVPDDPALAEAWFRRAALQGHAQAEDNYGLALFQAGKKEDALPWLQKSVARGEPRAQLVLGTMLFNGDSVPRDVPRAYALMTRASAADLKSASETLAQMDGAITPADRQRGLELARTYEAQARLAPVQPDRAIVRPGDPAPVQLASASVPVPTPAPTPRATPSPRATPTPRARPTPRATPSPRATPTPGAAPTPRATPTPRPAATPKPAATPRATAARPAPAPRSTGGYRVQLGAFREAGNARALWSRIGARVGGQASYPVAGGFTRLQAGPFRTRAEALRACTAARTPCVVVSP